MSRELARTSIVTAVDTLKSSFGAALEVELPNQLTVNMDTASEPFLRVSIKYHGSHAASIGVDKHLRAYGGVLLEVFAKPGTGTKTANEVLEHFGKGLHMRGDLPGIRTAGVNYLDDRALANGWMVFPAIVPFWFDDFN